MRYIVALVGLALVFGQALADPYCDALTDEAAFEIWVYAKLGKEFSQIDKYLQENEPSEDKLINIEKAKTHLREIQRDASWSLEFGHGLEKALYAVRALPQVLADKTACSLASYQALMKLIIPLECRSHIKIQAERSRLEQIVFEYASEHAKLCAPKYLEIFTEEYAKIEQETKDIVAKLFTPDIEKKILANVAGHTDDTNILNVGLERDDFYRVPIKDILARIEESFAPLPTQDSFATELVDKYVITPCRKFKGSLKGIFMPARLDMLLNEDQWMQKEAEATIRTSDEFKQVWHSFRLCYLLLSQEDQELIEIFKEVAYPEATSLAVDNQTTKTA